MLKLKLQYFGQLMWRTNSLEKTLMLGRIEGRRRRGQQRMRWLDGITNSIDMSLSKSGSWWWTGKPGMLQSWSCKELDTTEELNWTELMCDKAICQHLDYCSPGEGNGNPLQCSCLEDPRDEGAWWAAVYGVAQSWTRLKRLSSSSSSVWPENILIIFPFHRKSSLPFFNRFTYTLF